MVRLTQDSVESEAIVLGSNDDYKVYEEATGELVVEDLNNQTRGFIKPEVNGEIGGDGRLVTALKNEEPMADDGETYPTIQAAENAASSWVFVPPGTYNESVTIDTDGLTLQGAGYNTLVDGETTGTAIKIDADNVTIKNLSAQTTPGNSNDYHGIGANGSTSPSVINCNVRQADERGIDMSDSSDGLVVNCRISAETYAIVPEGTIISNCFITSSDSGDGANNRAVDDGNGNNIITSNIVGPTGGDGLFFNAPVGNNVIVGNRIISAGEFGIDIVGNDNNIVANNRISDSGNSDINDTGTNTTLDSNLTGPAN